MKRMLIDANHEEETRVAILDHKQILEFDYASTTKKQIKGNVYLAKVTRVEPSLQAAFVEYGGGRQGFLPFSEIHPDYYQIPVSDRKKLIEEVQRELQEDAEEEEAEMEARQSRGPRRKRRPRTRRARGDKDAKDTKDTKDNADGKESKADSQDATADDAKATEKKAAPDKDAPAAKDEPKAASDKNAKADDGDKKDDTPTQYAKKDEPSEKSEIVVDDKDEKKKPTKAKAKKADKEDAAEATEEKKKPRVRRTLRGRVRKKAEDKDADVKEDEASPAEPEAAPAVAEAESVSQEEAKRLGVNPPAEVALGAALFSEDKPFDAPGEEEVAEEKKPARKTRAKKAVEVDDADDSDDSEEEGIETLDSEEESVKPTRKKRVPFFKRYKIQEVVKRGQVVLVQATKEERGNKGASMTTYLSLAGRYCVLMPNSPRDGGVSRKISDSETRKRLKDVMSQLTLAAGMSVIIRTAGIDRNRTEIRRDFDYLVKLWNQIRDGTLSATAPALIYEENNLIKRAIRDLYTSDIDEVLVEGEDGYEEVKEFMKMLMPSHTGRVKAYNDNMPLFYNYGIEDQLSSMHDPVVKLKSGGYLVINPTEALISIDVNSGRSTGERNIEETAIKTNVEAAHEVARQLRLRDLAGLVVIDFIDMMDSRNRRSVERNIKDALRSDRAKIQVGRISPFGLMEMSRQRLRPSIGETMHTACETCDGRGLVRAPDSLALHLVRTLEKEAVSGRWAELKLNVSQQIALYMLNHKRTLITQIEARHGVNIVVDVDTSLGLSDFNIEKVKALRGEGRPAPKRAASNKKDDEESDDKPRRGRRSRGVRNNRSNQEDNADNDNQGTADSTTPSTDSQDKAVSEEVKEKPTRGRTRTRSKPDVAADAEDGSDKKAPEEKAEQTKAEELPEFTKKPALEEKKEEKVVAMPEAEAAPEPLPDTARPKGAPPRKGWWQQMIELD